MAVYAEERQEAIAGLVRRHGRAGVNALARMFDVTPETVRRDLDRLERHGLVRRVHGGAVPAGSLQLLETDLGDRERASVAEKDRIAAAAAAYLPPSGGCITIDAGTTTGRLGAHIPHSTLMTVVTNAVPVAARLAPQPGIDVHLVGGRIRGITQAAVGPETVAALAGLRSDVAFLGANGVTAAFGASTPDPDEAAAKRGLAATGERVVVLADATKLGREHLHRFVATDSIDVLVTDERAPRDVVADLEEAGVTVVLA